MSFLGEVSFMFRLWHNLTKYQVGIAGEAMLRRAGDL